MIDFSTLKSLTIPEGNVIKIASNGNILWEKIVNKLPSEYQEVEYLSAPSGTGAYIDLGFTFDTKAKIYMTQVITDTSVVSYPFGTVENSGALRCCLSSPYSNGSTFYGSSSTSHFESTVANQVGDNAFEMIIEPNKVLIKNITMNKTGPTRTAQVSHIMQNNLYLFAQNYNGAARFGGDRIIKSFKYYDKTDTLICDLVPCYRKSDKEPGMYDLISKKFLTNVGTGKFVC